MRKLVVLAVAILGLTWVLTARDNRAVANPVPVEVHIPDASGNPIQKLGASLVVAEPKVYRNLRIFPLLAENQSGKSFLPIDRAIRKGDLEVREKGSGEVNTVKVRNNGGSLVFGLSGDMIVGAKQDRMLKEDVLIPAHSGWLELEVYCTEHGRWTAQTEKFGSISRVVPGALRARAAQTESQSEVWDGVAEAKSSLGTATGGTALRGLYDDPKVQEKAQDYVRELMPVPGTSARTIGVLVAVGDEVLCVDVFASHSLLADMWDKLLNSYAIDAMSRSATGRLSLDDARAFIRSLEDADIESRSTSGKGRLYRVTTGEGSGSALVHDGDVIHLDLFPGHSAPKYDYRPGSTPNLEFRRGQH
jgi:hypothetical protein